MSVVDILIRISLAIIIGGFIGYEREMSNRPAGFITHTLVCVGACVVSLIQRQMIYDTLSLIEVNPALADVMKADLGRVVAQVVTGVGFLGAGTIIFDKGSIKGLTTATTIWVVACIGLAIGLGYYKIGVIAGLGIFFIIVFLRKLETYARNRQFLMVLELVYKATDNQFVEDTVKFFRKNKVAVRDIKLITQEDMTNKGCRFLIYFGLLKNREVLIEKLSNNDSVISITRKELTK